MKNHQPQKRLKQFALQAFIITLWQQGSVAAYADSVFTRDNELWLNSADGKCRQITSDGREKYGAEISPNNGRIAFIVNDKVKNGVKSKISVINQSGKPLWSAEVKSVSGEDCPSINMLEWIDDKRLGVETHLNPSLSQYHVIEAGKTKSTIYCSGPHAWSPFRNSFAYGGPYPHFSSNSPITSNYLVIDDTIVYDPGNRHESYFAELIGRQVKDTNCSKEDDEREKHEFIGNLAWSANGKSVALCDKITGAYFLEGKTDWDIAKKPGATNNYLVIAGKGQAVQKFKINTGAGKIKDDELRVNWLKDGSVSVSCLKQHWNFKPRLN